MPVFRRVMQVFWLVVVAAGAAALVKLAFFPDAPTVDDAATPGAAIVEPHWVVERGTVSNDVTLSASVAADEAVPITANFSGTAWHVYVAPGQWVTAGQEVVEVRGEVMVSDGTSYTDYRTLTAPATGVLSSLTAYEDASVTAGSAIGQIAPPTFHITGTIPPEELYRLIQRPTEATVTVNGGPAPFTCTGLQIVTPLAGQDSGSGNGAGTGATTGPEIRCAVPADVTVFAGLSAEVVVPGAIAADVVVVPTTALLGRAGTGVVYAVLPDGSTEERTVTLGINDGAMVEVTGGLTEGETILQFVPGAPSASTGSEFVVDPGSGVVQSCTITPDGGSICTGG